MGNPRVSIVFALSLSSVTVACLSPDNASPGPDSGAFDSGLVGIDAGADTSMPGSDSGTDASTGTDGSAGTDAPSDAVAPPTYNDPTVASKWSQVDLATVGVAQRSFTTSVFDGRYLYFAPGYDGFSNPQSQIARYDTQAAWTSASSWTTFDVSRVNAAAKELGGAAFDGRYIYFAPQGQDSAGSQFVRYDTQAAFATVSSWTTFDSTTLPSARVGFRGMAFDGRYIYASGGLGKATFNPYVLRYDTHASFTQIASWEEYATAYVVPYASYNDGVVWDGRYLYFNVIYANSAYSAQIVRYDSQLGFAAAGAWSKFNLISIVPGEAQYAPGVFDGRYVYYANPSGKVVRLDPQIDFTTAAAWKVFDVTTIDPGAKNFFRGGFDGRYMYFGQVGQQPSGKSPMARFDTQGSFTSAAAWTTIDLSQFAAPQPFVGAGGFAFDGRYMYIAPSIGDQATALRFDARTPPAIPPSYKGSFY